METTDRPKAKVKWPVVIKNGEGSMDGVTHSLTCDGVYIRCAKPLRLNKVCDIVIDAPDSEHPIQANTEVVWSNIYGPDDEINPRGMHVNFLEISDEDQKIISKAILKNLQSNKENTEPRKLEAFQTLIIGDSEIASEVT